MSETAVASPSKGLFPEHRALLTAIVVNGIGPGLFVPFTVLYFLHATTIPLASVGAALTAGTLLAVPTPLLAGPLIDRFGPRALAIAGNLLSAVAFAGYLFVDSSWQLAAAALVAAVGRIMSSTALVCLVRLVAGPGERPRWFAMQSVARNAGYGLGGIVGAVAVSAGGPWAYPLLVAGNAASFIIVAAAVAQWRIDKPLFDRNEPDQQLTVSTARYLNVLRNRNLRVIIGVNLLLVICMSALSVLVPVYLVDTLRCPAWLGGALFTLNTVIVVFGQTSVTRRSGVFRKYRVVQGAAAAWALAFLCLWLLNAMPGWLVLPGAVLAVIACTLAEMLHVPTINALAVDTTPTSAPGRHLALYQLSWGLGTALAPGLLIWLLAKGAQWPWPTLTAICLIAAGGISLLNTATLRRDLS